MTLAERFRALGPQGQIVLAVATAISLTLIIGVAYWLMRPTYEVLFTDLRANDAATIVAELDEQGVAYRLADEGTTILVHEDQVDAMRLHVAGSDLPLRGVVGFELFNRSDMGLTEFAQRINYQRALQGELARTIMTIEAVESARVHLTITQPTVFRADRQPPKASVTLTARAGRTISPENIEGIRRLVAAAVSELEPANVVIMDQHGVATGGEAVIDDVASDLQQVRAIEQFYAGRIRQTLEAPYPDLHVEVLAPHDQWSGVAGEGDALREAVLAQWSPERRLFRLDVRVSSDRPLTSDDQVAVTEFVRQATGGEYPGDRIGFERAAPLSPLAGSGSAAIEEGTSEPGSPTSVLTSPSQTWAIGLSLGLAVFAVAALILYLNRPRKQGLSPAQRAAFSRRLRQLLEEDDVSPLA